MEQQPIRPRPGFLESARFPTVMRFLSRAHVQLYRRSNGRLGAKMPVDRKRILPVCLLEHTGRRSGRVFTTPLLYFADDDRIVLVAAQGGLPEDPQWYRNLSVTPECRITTGRTTRDYRTRTATPEERADLWPRLTRHYPGWAAYQSWCGEREIPVVICDPV